MNNLPLARVKFDRGFLWSIVESVASVFDAVLKSAAVGAVNSLTRSFKERLTDPVAGVKRGHVYHGPFLNGSFTSPWHYQCSPQSTPLAFQTSFPLSLSSKP